MYAEPGSSHRLTKQAHQVVGQHGSKPKAASVAQKPWRLKAFRPKSAFSSLIRFSQSARALEVRQTSTIGSVSEVTKAPWRQPTTGGITQFRHFHPWCLCPPTRCVVKGGQQKLQDVVGAMALCPAGLGQLNKRVNVPSIHPHRLGMGETASTAPD